MNSAHNFCGPADTGEGRGGEDVLYVAYIMFTVTLVIGLTFFWHFDRTRRALPKRWLITHVILAVITFTFWTTALSGYTWKKPAPVYRSPSPWSDYVRHEHMRHHT